MLCLGRILLNLNQPTNPSIYNVPVTCYGFDFFIHQTKLTLVVPHSNIARRLYFKLNLKMIHFSIGYIFVWRYSKTKYIIGYVIMCSIAMSNFYGGPERTWCKYILSRYSDLASRYSDLLSRYIDLTKSL